MDETTNYLNPETLSRLRGLDLQARMIVEGVLSGYHRSPFHGFSVEFAQHREYVPGDDLRYVDWKVFGKSDRYYLKQYEEETSFACYLLLDSSESMGYQSEQAAVSKLEYAKYVAAALAYMVVRQQDAVGLATFDSGVTNFVRASGRPSHLRQVFHVMEQTPAEGATAIAPILHELAERTKKRGLVIVISDFFDDVESLATGLNHFRYCGHDVSLLHVIDPAERDFPFDDPTLFRGLEGEPQQMADPRSLKRAYQAEFEGFLRQLRAAARQMHMDYELLRTDYPLEIPLRSYLTRRMQTAGRT